MRDIPKMFTAEFFVTEYHEKYKSVRQIAKETGFSSGNIRHHMKRLQISPRERDEAIRLKSKKNISVEILEEFYCKQKLGAPIIAKRLGCSYATVYKCLLEYGIAIRSLSDAYFCHSHPLKGKHLKETTKQKIRDARMRQRIPTCLTQPELEMKRICEQYSIPLKYVGDGSFWISGLNPDFIDEERRIILEVFGRYWHTPNSKMNLPYYSTYEGRISIFKRLGWFPIIFWDDELCEEIVLERLGAFYGQN